MATTFHILGNSLTARRSFSGATCANLCSISGNRAVVGTTGYMGEIGGSSIIIDPNNAGAQNNYIQYIGRNSVPAHALSMLWRGSFGVNTGLLGVCSFGSGVASSYYAVQIFYNGGTLSSRIKDAQVNDRGSINVTWTPTVNRIYDILLTWNGENGGIVTLYVDGVSVGTVAASYQRAADDRPNVNYITIGAVEFDVAATKITTNEFYLDDAVLNPASVTLTSGTGSLNGQSRTAFMQSTAIDGTVNIDPGVSNVLAPTAYEIAGVSLTGTLGPSTDPGPSNVASGVAYEINGVNKVGTLNSVNNVLANAVLTGQSVNAVLVQQ